MRARWLRFGLTLGVSLGVVGLALAIGMTRGDAPGADAQGATPTAAPTLPSGDAPSLPSGGGVTLATPTPTAASTPSSASTPEISDDSHLGRTTPTPAPVVTAIRQTAPTLPTTATTATTLPANPPTCTTTTLGGTRTANALLAADCDTLLAIETTLAGTVALNWDPGTALTSWEGVTVGGTPKRVTQIVIHGGKRTSKLNGTLATQLGNLTGLRRLDLNDHSLTGAIPTQLGKLTALTYIDLAANALTGSVPTQLEALTKLEYLWLWKTKLSGPLPTQLGVLTKLRVLSFNGASLSGEIPTQVGNLTALTEVALGGNSLGGEIPTELESLTALTRLELQNNSLSGAIPAEMGSLTKLTLLRLSGNSLTGCVPNVLAGVATHDLGTSLSFCPAPAPDLTVLADGVAGVLILEWTSTAVGITRWQYRHRELVAGGRPETWGTWGAWTNVPGSNASTRTYRLTGVGDAWYQVEVRAWTTIAGTSSSVVEGTPAYFGSDGIPWMLTGQMNKGGKEYRISGTKYVVTIPSDMRIVVSGGGIGWGRTSMRLTDVESGSYLQIDLGSGEFYNRHVVSTSGSGSVSGSADRDVNALFDQIVASKRTTP